MTVNVKKLIARTASTSNTTNPVNQQNKQAASVFGSGYSNGNYDSAVRQTSINSDYKADSRDDKNGQIDTTRQRNTGNCWLLSGINSLSYTKEGQETIKKALDYQDGYTVVHLATGDYVITDAELASVRAQNKEYSDGDDDMLILELAVEKTLDDYANGKYSLAPEASRLLELSMPDKATTFGESSTEGGFSSLAYYLLTGKQSEYISDYRQMQNALERFDRNNNQDYVMSASGKADMTGNMTVRDANGNKLTLPARHAYAIKGVSGNTVTIVNPWDSSKTIEISREDFCKNFAIQACDLSDNNPAVNYIKFNQNYSKYGSEKINGAVYNVENNYTKEGVHHSTTYRIGNGDVGIRYYYDIEGNIISSEIGIFDENGEFEKSEEYKTSQIADNVLERNLLSYGFSFEELTGEGGLATIEEEEWSEIEELSGSVNLTEYQTKLISELNDRDREFVIEILEENPKANITEIISFLNSKSNFSEQRRYALFS